MKLKTDTWVAVCDGGKFLLLQNHGDVDVLDLRVVAHEEIDDSAQPGRKKRGPSPDGTQARTGRANNQSVEAIAEHRFVQSVAAELEERIRSGGIGALVLIADPKTLGLLRARMSDRSRDVVCEEIDGDFARKTIAEVEAFLARH